MRLIQKKGPFSKGSSFKVGGASLNEFVHVGIQIPKTQPMSPVMDDTIPLSSSQADAAGDTTTLTAHVYRAGAELSSSQVAKMGLIAWYVGGSRVATGSTYTCAAGTAVECRLEA
jgi:hypothetical protein